MTLEIWSRAPRVSGSRAIAMKRQPSSWSLKLWWRGHSTLPYFQKNWNHLQNAKRKTINESMNMLQYFLNIDPFWKTTKNRNLRFASCFYIIYIYKSYSIFFKLPWSDFVHVFIEIPAGSLRFYPVRRGWISTYIPIDTWLQRHMTWNMRSWLFQVPGCVFQGIIINPIYSKWVVSSSK